jgi:integrase
MYRPIIERFLNWTKASGAETAKQLFPPGERRFALYEQYYEKLKTTISPSTANIHIVIIGRMFRVDMLRAVPAILVNPHVHLDKIASGEIRWFSEEELSMVRKAANDRQLFTIDYLVSGGLRSGEMINLRPFQIRTDVISIVPHDDWTPKWGKTRHIPKNERAKECEEYFRSKYTAGNYVWGTSRSKGIVPAGHDGLSYVHDSLVSKVEEEFHYKGLSDTSPHTYRATCGSLMLQNKIPVEFVMKFLGHRNLHTTLKHYASLCVGNLQEAANSLDYIFK